MIDAAFFPLRNSSTMFFNGSKKNTVAVNIIRCGFCVSHEVDSHYCPNCAENMPSAEARLKKNRQVQFRLLLLCGPWSRSPLLPQLCWEYARSRNEAQDKQVENSSGSLLCLSHEMGSHSCPNRSVLCVSQKLGRTGTVDTVNDRVALIAISVSICRCANCLDCPFCSHTLSTRATSMAAPSPEDPTKVRDNYSKGNPMLV
jgi:hypothetical protein